MTDFINILLIIFLVTMISFFIYQFYNDFYPKYQKYLKDKESEKIVRYKRPEDMEISSLLDIKKRIRYIKSLNPGDPVKFFNDLDGTINQGIFASYSEDQFQVIIFFISENNILSSYRVPFSNIREEL